MLQQTAKRIARNIAGYSLLAVGLFLSVPLIPGPGFAFVLAGLALADWPGRKRFFRWLRTFPWFDACAEWIHRKFHFRLPGARHPESSSSLPAEEDGQSDIAQDHPPASNEQPSPDLTQAKTAANGTSLAPLPTTDQATGTS